MGILLQHAAVTALESTLGLGLALLTAVSMATLFHFSKTLDRMLGPVVVMLKAVPLIVFAPVLLLAWGEGVAANAGMAALVAFFPILVSARQGFTSCPRSVQESLKLMGASRWQVFRYGALPWSQASIWAGMKTASCFAVVGAVVAEWTSADQGVGHFIITQSYYLNTALMFAAIVMTGIFGILLYGVCSLATFRFRSWSALA